MMYCEKKYVAKIIQKARKKKGLKQSELAEKIGISEKHLSKIETGKNYPALDNFLKIMDVLDLSLKDFGLRSLESESKEKIELQKIINVASEEQIELYLDIIKILNKHI